VKESDIQTKILRWAEKLPEIWIVKYPGGTYGRKGVPDLLLSVKGKFLAIEVKKPGGKPTQMQLMEQEKIRMTGSRSEIVESFVEAKDIILEVLNG
jgi:hypothetical protein